MTPTTTYYYCCEHCYHHNHHYQDYYHIVIISDAATDTFETNKLLVMQRQMHQNLSHTSDAATDASHICETANDAATDASNIHAATDASNIHLLLVMQQKVHQKTIYC